MRAISLRKILIICIVTSCGLGSFLVTVYARRGSQNRFGQDQNRGPVAAWLNLDVQQTQSVLEADPDFMEDTANLNSALEDESNKLAELMENPDTDGSQILQQVENVIAIRNQIERRVAKHVVAIRPYLLPEQRSKLFDLCARKVRRRGRGHGNGSGNGNGNGHGRGRGRSSSR